MGKEEKAILRLLFKTTAMKPEEIEQELETENLKPVLNKLERANLVQRSGFGYSITGRGLDELPMEFDTKLVPSITIRN